MKDFIKETLRENVSKNSLGVVITRPNQELIIMRGIPGAGKSTAAKKLVGEGIIHSTDNVIESMGDYRAFFVKMVESKNFFPLQRAHSSNFKNAKVSMEAGISPVIIDNTNIKANEAKKYVTEALNLGYSDDNIRIVDIGNAGEDAETLAKRNSHGVPLAKIEEMMKSHKSVGPLTVQKILESKDMFKPKKKILYSAVVLDEKSRGLLIQACSTHIPQGWSVIAHHMTIIFGQGLPEEMKSMLGKTVKLTVDGFGVSDMAIAVRVSGFKTLTGKTPHITVAINTAAGAKPVMGGQIEDFDGSQTKMGLVLTGVVTEVTT